MARVVYRWGVEWHSASYLDGDRRWVMWENGKPLWFQTRREAREYNQTRNGYIKNRPDLQSQPHGWKMPRVVKLRITEEVL